jgi:N-ethylmaleimide reductase
VTVQQTIDPGLPAGARATNVGTAPVAPGDVAVLFEPYRINAALQLKNRIMLAPCTRCRALPGLVPTPGAVEYYGDRAGAGLLVSEAIMINATTQGYRDTPGIWSPEQVEGWTKVTARVHERGGLILAQLWHLGRLSHPHYSGAPPVGPSVVPTEGLIRSTRSTPLYHVNPRELSSTEIEELVAEYAQCAFNAIRADFDGVEIHAGNGYLPEQFLRQLTNKRTDAWGGSAAKRARFPLAVAEAVADRIGAERVAIRLSPAAYFGLMSHTPGDEDAYIHLLEELSKRGIAYVHTGIIDDATTYDYLGGTSTEFLRRYWKGTLVSNGGYGPMEAAQAIRRGTFDLIAFGRLFIANADLVERLRSGAGLRPYAREILDTLS